ncbi:NFX1-type zinc finger-containing protein 1 [Biomphalaria pfeifferi]|uniref:NFX1-type zinc finger-containing protein 1 n=1 Tax=Biomphalaria pfeifferi TaxID=112525 RepID=A0AAD8EYB6_BIOPF|nr:NFX1-type zinc finger-containing protein 1 [Biomphalaria pfeifferi]
MHVPLSSFQKADSTGSKRRSASSRGSGHGGHNRTPGRSENSGSRNQGRGRASNDAFRSQSNSRGRGRAQGTARGTVCRSASVENISGEARGQRRMQPFIFTLKRWSEIKESGKLIIQICLEKESLESFLSHTMVAEEIMLLLKVVSFAMTSQHQKESIKEVLDTLCKARFLEKNVTEFLTQKRLYEETWPDANNVFDWLITIIEEVLSKVPKHANQCVALSSHLANLALFFTQIKTDAPLFQNLSNLKSKSFNVVKAEGNKSQANKESNFFDTGDSKQPPDNFEDLPVVPTLADLKEDARPFLRHAVVNGAYDDVRHYLDIQFRLMKQDFILPLRLGINELIRSGCKKDFWSSDIRIYQNVHIDDMDYKDSIDHVLQFDVSKLKNVKWDVSKRLIYGSLLCLSKDNFKNVIFATVAKRDVRKLSQGFITVSVKTGHTTVFSSSSSDTFVMVETTAYFESYQHVLKGLQEMSSNLPLQDYIIKCQTSIRPPKYLLLKGQVPVYDITCLMNPESPISDPEETSVPVLTTVKWPPTHKMCLNESQREAAQMALTKEIALIQGPPGTGKTYVGLKVMETLLANKLVRLKNSLDRSGDPILVVCYTNHALDQFLEGVLKFCPQGIIRVGGKSSSELLEEYNLRTVRQKLRKEKSTDRSVRALKAKCMEELNEYAKKIFQTHEVINNLDIEPLSEDFLKPYISPSHFYSLCQGQAASNQSCMKQWLNVSNESLQKVVPIAIKKHLTNLILNMRHAEPVPYIDNMDIIQRAHFYICLLREFRNALYQEMMYLSQFPPDLYIQGRINNLQSMFHFSFTSILPDQLLQWVLQGYFEIDKFLHRLSSVVLKTHASEYNDKLVECWLLGLHNSLHKQLDDIQAFTSKHSGVSIDDFDDAEASKEAQDARIIDDGDDSDDDDFGVGNAATASLQKIKYSKDSFALVMQRMDMLGINEEADVKTEQDAYEWTTVKHKKVLSSRKIRHKLITTTPMTQEEANKVNDVWTLEPKRRFSLYKYWSQKYKEVLTRSMEEFVLRFNDLYERKQELNSHETLTLLKSAQVIGMTTTGAAKHRAVLQALGCRIIVVEEAAEVLESHIVTALNKNCNHLILIGDHQQLRPNPTVYDLAKHYGLEISLFERLIKNKVPHVLLKEQHRMRPEISKIMRHIYKNLEDHESVTRYENIDGVSKNIFFINHKELESRVDDTKSKANKHEAKFVTALAKYFILHGYDPSKITILATYTGQVFAIKKTMNETKFTHRVRVTAVDNYQGEENEIIILSLVRSNLENSVGFLKVDNRVCVALSRAKKGLFVIGNFDLLAKESVLWKNIVATAREENIIGQGLPVGCTSHPEFQECIVTAKDFDKCPDGGCGQPCNFQLSCGHICPRTCHALDREHKEYKCLKQCPKSCPQGHKCTKKCHQVCGDCNELVMKIISSCGHEDKVKCSLPEHEAICSNKCLALLSCGHQCPGQCGHCRKQDRHFDCTELVPFVWPCGHESVKECSKRLTSTPCPKKCGATLDCGHKCQGTCSDCLEGAVHIACEEKCDKKLPCGHKCQGYCGENCMPCTLKCPDRCSHGYCSKGKHTQLCGDKCNPCTQPCSYSCSHSKCSKSCSDFCNAPPCYEKCNKKVHKCSKGEKCRHKLHSCSHTCSGLCGERCVCAVCEKVSETATAEKVSETVAAEEESSTTGILTQLQETTLDDDELNNSSAEHTSDTRTDSTTLVLKLECGHIFRVDDLDIYVNKFDPDGCQYLHCPVCQQLITESRRYNRVIKGRRRQREIENLELRKQRNVMKKETEKLILSENQFDDSHFFDAFRGKGLEHIRNKSELNAKSFQFKCAYVLHIISLLRETNMASDKVIEGMKKALLKIRSRVTTQQKSEFTRELRRLLNLSHIQKLEIFYSFFPPNVEAVKEVLSNPKVARQDLEKGEEFITNTTSDFEKDVFFRTNYLAEYKSILIKVDDAKRVLHSGLDKMLYDVLNPPADDLDVENLKPTSGNDASAAFGNDESLVPPERFSNKLSHMPMAQITVPLPKLAKLPSLQEWGIRSQAMAGPHAESPNGMDKTSTDRTMKTSASDKVDDEMDDKTDEMSTDEKSDMSNGNCKMS